MDKIREQIDDLNSVNVIHGPLRSWPIARCEEFADTMEKLLAVYEAAFDWIYDDWGSITKTEQLHGALEDAVNALQTTQEKYIDRYNPTS